jgi:hypothetical protein
MKKITPERNGKQMEYKATLNGNLIGYFKTPQEAQTELDRLALEAARRAS